MTSYVVHVYYWDHDRYLQRQTRLDGFATPMDAMARLAKFFEDQGGFGTSAFADCFDEDTGVTQWAFHVK